MCRPLIGMWDVLTDRFRICTVVPAVVEEGLLTGGRHQDNEHNVIEMPGMNSSVPVTFGSIWVTRLYGCYVMILVTCMVKACFSLFPRSMLTCLGQMYMPLKVLFFLYNHQ